MAEYLLLPLAVIPPILFMLFIFWMDRHKPESMKHVMFCLLLGALSTIPAIIVQTLFGAVPLFGLPGAAGGTYESFLLVAPSEEILKFLVIWIFIRRKPFFDEVNDGIVYYGTGAIGFALLENILYVLGNGLGTGILRAFTAIPLHTFCGVIVGYHMGLARFGKKRNPQLIILRGLFLAVITHASYNSLIAAESLLSLLFIPLVIGVYIIGAIVLRKGRKISMENIHHPQVISSEQVFTDVYGRRFLQAKKETWKAVIGRSILGVCAVVWIIVIWAGWGDTEISMLDIALGTFIITVIPVAVGLILEVSYQRRKNRKIYLY
ncbi:MAG: PrsW family intramembrane metalloprotease [Eubacteriales bacterium]|nr:PrsW family intramembrane metalloprotease [Eubacteriales bacterium]